MNCPICHKCNPLWSETDKQHYCQGCIYKYYYFADGPAIKEQWQFNMIMNDIDYTINSFVFWNDQQQCIISWNEYCNCDNQECAADCNLQLIKIDFAPRNMNENRLKTILVFQ